MNKTAIIIPSRLNAIRLPNKPLKLINNKEMILHVYEAAMKSNSGEVFVASPDEKIVDLVKKFGGKGILTKDNHETGTDRVFEVFKKCSACHMIAAGGKNMIGPNLWNVIGRTAGSVSDYKYSKAMVAYAKEWSCLLYTSPSPRDSMTSRMPSSA